METTIYSEKHYTLFEQISKGNLQSNELFVKDGRFNLVAANIKQIFPELNFENHKLIYKNINLYQKLSRLDQFYINSVENCELIDFSESIKNRINANPFIYTTFHLGSYRIINHFLIKQGISFDLLIAKSTYEREGYLFEEIFNKNKIADNQKIGLIDAENSTALFAMIRTLRNGRSLLIYMDGNTGINTNNKNNVNLFLTKLGKGEILARKGAIEISFLTNIPILNILSYIENRRTKLKFHPIINVDGKSRDDYINYTMNKIYKQFEELLSKYPDQWEGWYYIHKNLCIKNRWSSEIHLNSGNNNIKYFFNYNDYGIFNTNHKYYLFDKNKLLSYNINHHLFIALAKSINIKQSFSEFNNQTINNLLKAKIIYKQDESIYNPL